MGEGLSRRIDRLTTKVELDANKLHDLDGQVQELKKGLLFQGKTLRCHTKFLENQVTRDVLFLITLVALGIAHCFSK